MLRKYSTVLALVSLPLVSALADPVAPTSSRPRTDSEAVAKAKVIHTFNKFAAALAAKNGEGIDAVTSREYRNASNEIAKAFHYHFSDYETLEPFKGYTINGVNRIVINSKGVAFVEASITYDRKPCDRQAIRNQRPEKGKVEEQGAEWLMYSPRGGVVHVGTDYERGKGIATYCLIRQGTEWKLHMTYHTAHRLNSDAIQTLVNDMNPLVYL
jgi:hypothetical protein